MHTFFHRDPQLDYELRYTAFDSINTVWLNEEEGFKLKLRLELCNTLKSQLLGKQVEQLKPDNQLP
ncbi:hypothetical protein CR513_50395, partial [Mucuna pruriens]